MKIVDISTGLWKTDLNEDSTVSIPSLCSYFRYNIGELNSILGTCFTLNSTNLEIIDDNGNEINREAATIYKYIYLLSFYARQIRANLGVGGISQTIQISSDNGTVRLVDKTNISKVYQQLRKDIESTLGRLVNKYKMRNQNATSVEGDDTILLPGSDGRLWGESELHGRDII